MSPNREPCTCEQALKPPRAAPEYGDCQEEWYPAHLLLSPRYGRGCEITAGCDIKLRPLLLCSDLTLLFIEKLWRQVSEQGFDPAAYPSTSNYVRL